MNLLQKPFWKSFTFRFRFAVDPGDRVSSTFRQVYKWLRRLFWGNSLRTDLNYNVTEFVVNCKVLKS